MVQPYVSGAELPDRTFTWKDTDGNIIDFSTGWTFALKVTDTGQTTQFTKSSGFTGASTSPNVTVAWATSGELNSLSAGKYLGYLTATRDSDSKVRTLRFDITIDPGPSA